MRTLYPDEKLMDILAVFFPLAARLEFRTNGLRNAERAGNRSCPHRYLY